MSGYWFRSFVFRELDCVYGVFLGLLVIEKILSLGEIIYIGQELLCSAKIAYMGVVLGGKHKNLFKYLFEGY